MSEEKSKLINLAVGAKWYESEVEKYYTNIGKIRKQLNPRNIHKRKRIHPIIKAKIEADQIVERAKNRGDDFVLATAAMQKISILIDNIESLGERVNLEDLRGRLRDSREFPKVYYELHIAASYVRGGEEVEIINPKNSIRTYDFEITHIRGEGEKIAIECKDKDYSKKIDAVNKVFWQIQYKLHQRILKLEKSCGVILTWKKLPSSVEQEKIINKVVKVIGAPVVKLDDDLISAEIETFGNWGDEFPKNRLNNYYLNNFDLGSSQVEVSTESSTNHVRNAILIRVNILDRESVTKSSSSIINSLHKGAKQLPSNLPGIICIDIRKRSLENARLLMNLLQRKMRNWFKNHSRIAAVVVTSIDWLDTNGEVYYEAGNKVFFNPKPSAPLPKNFIITGSEQRTLVDDYLLLYPDSNKVRPLF